MYDGKYMGMSLNRSGHRAELSMLGSRGPLLRYSVNYVHSRPFSPAYGINPVTGAVTSVLADVLATCTIDGKVYGQFNGQRRTDNTYSQQFDHVNWTPLSLSPLGNDTTDPLGTNTADRLTDAVANDNHLIYISGTQTVASWAWSAFLKNGNRRYAQLRIWRSNNNWFSVVVDLQLGTITQVLKGSGIANLPTASILPCPNGWYYVTVCGVFTGAVIAVPAIDLLNTGTHVPDINGGLVYVGDGGYIYVWQGGLQSDVAFASPTILTTNAELLCSPDVGYWPSASVPAAMLSGQWTVDVYPEHSSAQLIASGVSAFIQSIDGNNGIFFGNTDGGINIYAGGAGVLGTGPLAWDARAHLVVAFDSAAGTVTLSGFTAGNGLHAGIPWSYAAANWYHGCRFSGTAQLFGHISEPY